MTEIILKIIVAILSPDFEEILNEIKKARAEERSRAIEAAKEAAQEGDSRGLQKVMGDLVE